MKGNKFRILGIAVIVAILAVAYQAYSTSVAEDFSNINCFELAQLLMNESTDKSIKDFYQLAINGEEVSENE